MRSLLLVGLIACVVCAVAFAQEKTAPQADPKAELMKSVERGKALWSDASLGTNGQSCASCHADPAKLAGVAQMYPKYSKMPNRVLTLDQVVNMCIVNPMKGKALAWDDPRMTDIVAYMASLGPAKGRPPEKEKETKKAK